MKRIVGAVGALVVHALLLLALIPSCGAPPAPSAPAPETRPETAKKLQGGQGLVEAKIIAPEGYNGPSCQGGSYVGIGILVGWGGTVKSIGENTPASRSGLKEGDLITNESDLNGEWKGGETIVLYVLRNNEKLEIGMKTEKICYE